MYFLPLLLACQDNSHFSRSVPNGTTFGGQALSKDNEESMAEYQPEFSLVEEATFSLINSHREEESLDSLLAHALLVDVARLHSEQMALGEVAFGHDGFEERIEEILASFSYATYSAAENVGISPGANAPQTMVETWLQSEGHRKNIEGSYTYSGIGSFDIDGTLYFTQIFLEIR